jgi:hypothetical protein
MSLLASCLPGRAREPAASHEPLLPPRQHQQQPTPSSQAHQNPLLPPRRPNDDDDDDDGGDDIDGGPSSSPPADVWILAGQSNCTGWNGPDGTQQDPLPPRPDGSVLMLTADGGALAHAREPTHLDVWGFDDRFCVGPGLSFARALRDGGGSSSSGGRRRTIVLVPCARGGSSLMTDWSPDAPDGDGTARDTRSGSLFGNCVRRALRAVELASALPSRPPPAAPPPPLSSSSSLEAPGPSHRVDGGGFPPVPAPRPRARLRGMVWVQGESDGSAEPSARAYAYNFANFLRRLREALRAAAQGGPAAVGSSSATTTTTTPLPIVLMAVMAARERERAFPFVRIVRDEQLWLAAKARAAREEAEAAARRKRRPRDRAGAPPPACPYAGVYSVDMAGFEFYPDGATARGKLVVDGNLVHLTKDGAAGLGVALGLCGAAAEAEAAEDDEGPARR